MWGMPKIGLRQVRGQGGNTAAGPAQVNPSRAVIYEDDQRPGFEAGQRDKNPAVLPVSPVTELLFSTRLHFLHSSNVRCTSKLTSTICTAGHSRKWRIWGFKSQTYNISINASKILIYGKSYKISSIIGVKTCFLTSGFSQFFSILINCYKTNEYGYQLGDAYLCCHGNHH